MPRSSKAEWQHQKYTERCHWSFFSSSATYRDGACGLCEVFRRYGVDQRDLSSGVIELCTAGSRSRRSYV
jgi:hypothetical protein